MTLVEYYNAPFGRMPGFSPRSLQATVASDIEEIFENKIPVHIVKTASGQLIFHCKLPSRKKDAVYFDVIVEVDLSTDPNSRLNIQRFPFRVFSNSPSFTYTFANAFRENGLLCEWLIHKYDPKIFKEDPKSRNPQKLVGYERTVYTCIHWLIQNYRQPAVDLYKKAGMVSYRSEAALVKTAGEVEQLYSTAFDNEFEKERKAKIAAQKEEQRKWREAKKAADRVQRASSSRMVQTSARINTTKKTGKSSKSRSSSKTKKL